MSAPAASADLLAAAARRASRYLESLDRRAVPPAAEALSALTRFEQPFPDAGCAAEQVLAELDDWGSPATVATAGGRYFGFVTGGVLPAALAANWMAGAWDQCAAVSALSPVAHRLESVALGWLLEALGLPHDAAGGFVTGATMANFAGLAAARHALLARQGWDVEGQGLLGAPGLRVVVGDEVHISPLKALALLGLGRDRVIRVPVDGQGRMRADALPPLDQRTLLLIQAGNVNTGAFDPAAELCGRAREGGSWVHVDGAFGLWAAAAPHRAHLTAGLADADSWAIDAHKWLNVPYDSGITLCRHPEALRAAMAVTAPYLTLNDQREPCYFTPEQSRRARGVEIWAALRSLGRSGLADLIERTCRLATRFAQGLAAAGYQVLNRVDLNQVLVSFGSDERTRRVIAALQSDGTCWCGGTVWQGRTAMRISVSSWGTDDRDVDQCLAAMLRVAERA